jgi:hypothetical protein
MTANSRLAALLATEKKAEALFEAIESQRLVRPGRTETEVDRDIFTLAERSFGVKKHWHKRIVRSGPNTVCIFAENPPVREIAEDDTVFLDLGPVFDEWEADVGRTYVMGNDPEKHRLCRDLPRIFDALKQYFDGHHDVTGYLAPGGECPSGGLHRTVDIGRVATRDISDRAAFGGIFDGQNSAGDTIGPVAIDQHLRTARMVEGLRALLLGHGHGVFPPGTSIGAWGGVMRSRI